MSASAGHRDGLGNGRPHCLLLRCGHVGARHGPTWRTGITVYVHFRDVGDVYPRAFSDRVRCAEVQITGRGIDKDRFADHGTYILAAGFLPFRKRQRNVFNRVSGENIALELLKASNRAISSKMAHFRFSEALDAEDGDATSSFEFSLGSKF